ncbi:unknown [Bifidobacterium adolescentis CAG:119]|nr:unknown [Bifidobacterium adolescentis CAG:119]
MVLSMYSAVFSPVSTVPLDKVTGPLISTIFWMNTGSTEIKPSMLQAYCERCHEALSISALRETSGTAKVSRTSKEKPNGLLNTACSSAVPLLPLTNSPFGWKSPTAILP